jgi:PAS domain S-box-containing protein
MALALLAWSAVGGSAVLGDGLSKEPRWRVAGSWRQPQGLPQDTIYTLLQTRDGYLWAGTRAGLARFDGARFTTFDDSRLPENEVWALTEGSDGSLWIGTYGGGLCRLKNGVFTAFAAKDGLRNNFINELACDAQGTVWIGTDVGLCAYKDGAFISYDTEVSHGARSIRAIYCAPDGTTWVGSNKDELLRVEGAKLVAVPVPGLKPASEIRAICTDRENALWIGTINGLVRLKAGEATWYTKKEGLSSDAVRRLFMDTAGQLWIATGDGVDRMKDGRIYNEVASPSLVGSLCGDLEGGVWMGTVSDGLSRLHQGQFISYTVDEGLSSHYVTAVLEDRQHTLWVGTSEGLNRLEATGSTFKSFFPQDALSSRRVCSLMEKRDGEVWVGMETGLFRFRYDVTKDTANSGPAFMPVEVPGLPVVFVRALFEDRDGVVWLGTHNSGLVRCRDGNQFDVFTTQNGLPDNAIRGITQDSDGTLWFGTRNGLCAFRDGRFTVYREKDGLPSDAIQELYRDSQDIIWIATRRGLGWRKDGRFHFVRTTNGLFANHISSLTEDAGGNLWLSCAKGIFRAKRSDILDCEAEKIPAIECVSYGLEHGLSSTSAVAGTHPGAFKSSDGRLWFAMLRGVCVVDPKTVGTNSVIPQVHIESVAIDDHSFHSDNIEAEPGRGDMAIRYTATSFVAPQKIKFKYRVEGYDPDWIEAGNRREAFYNRLPPGSYIFSVIAANSDGRWNNAGAHLAFVIRPHFYQTGWFRVGLGVLAAAGLGLAYRTRMRHVQRRARELEQQNSELERRVAERAAELAKSYETLRASEYFYSSLVESLPQAIARKDASGRFTYVNGGFAELIGLPPAQIIGRNDYELCPDQAEKHRADDQRVMSTGRSVEYEEVVAKTSEVRRYLHVKKVPLIDKQGAAIGVQVLSWDRTTFRETEEKLRMAQRELIETSRLAGIAEVATGVLHNIGNALNSVNISASVAAEAVNRFRIPSLDRVAKLLLEQGDRLVEFYASDPRARQLPQFLNELAASLRGDQETANKEMAALRSGVEHIKEIVAAQQSHARVTGVNEEASPAELVEYALRMSDASLARHGITVTRDFQPTPVVQTQRQKVLQVLINLISNAKEAMTGMGNRQLVIGIRSVDTNRIAIQISDNGIGIAPENLTRIFAFGFTTKKKGHGFGLHSSALAARELGGTLNVTSEGIGRGATFVLELPCTLREKTVDAPPAVAAVPGP